MNASNATAVTRSRTDRARLQVRWREISLMVRRIVRRSRGALTVEEARRVAEREALVGMRTDHVDWRRPGWVRYDWHREPESVRSYIARQIATSRASRPELP